MSVVTRKRLQRKSHVSIKHVSNYVWLLTKIHRRFLLGKLQTSLVFGGNDSEGVKIDEKIFFYGIIIREYERRLHIFPLPALPVILGKRLGISQIARTPKEKDDFFSLFRWENEGFLGRQFSEFIPHSFFRGGGGLNDCTVAYTFFSLRGNARYFFD